MNDLEILWSRLVSVAALPGEADGRALFAIEPVPVKLSVCFQVAGFGVCADPAERGAYLPMGRPQ